MKNIYVCVTLYHVYLSLLFIYSGSFKNDSLLILNANNENIYNEFKKIKQRLDTQGINAELRFCGKNLLKECFKNMTQYTILVKKYPKLNSGFTLINFAWNNSYVYTSAARLYKKCASAIFVEEGACIAYMKPEKALKKMIHTIIGGSGFYKDKKLDCFYVQLPESFSAFPPIWRKKIKRLNIFPLISRLSHSNKNAIISAFLNSDKDLPLGDATYGIIYTGPYSEDGYISEQRKIEIVLQMCNYYKNYGNVILKIHPRDLTNYCVEKDVIVFPGTFPSEVLNLFDIKYRYAVSLESTSVLTTNACYKINLNPNFGNDKKFELKPLY